MTDQQPEALRLSEILDSHWCEVWHQVAAAKELRRLHAENEELKQQIAAAQPAQQGLEQDAARYRWLRKSPNPACDIALAKHFGGGRGQDFDALIDAALAAQAKQEEK